MRITILATTAVSESLGPLQDILVCPTCRSDLENAEDGLCCSRCDTFYQVADGIPLFGIFGESSDFSVQSEAGQAYEYKFTSASTPQSYDQQFVDDSHKRTRTEREVRILGNLLSRTGRVNAILNVPCGGGRLSQPLAQACSLLVEADVALPQVRFAREHGDYSEVSQAAWMTLSAFHLPCVDRGFDGVVCARLIHHFSEPEDHRRLLAELCRVAKQFVIVSFNDSFSVKSISRRLRGRHNPHTLNGALIDEMVRPHGFVLRTAPAVSPLGSRHRYALLTRS